MRTFDLTPLYRSTVGFDRLFSMLDQGLEGAPPGYPPYNIERTSDNEYRVTVAVAGFAENELSVVAKENTLTMRGEKNAKEEEKRGDVLYQGIAAFERSSALSSSRAPSLRTASCTSTSCARSPRRRSPARSRSATATRPSSTKRRPKRPGFEIRCNEAPRFSGALFVGAGRAGRPGGGCQSRSS